MAHWLRGTPGKSEKHFDAGALEVVLRKLKRKKKDQPRVAAGSGPQQKKKKRTQPRQSGNGGSSSASSPDKSAAENERDEEEETPVPEPITRESKETSGASLRILSGAISVIGDRDDMEDDFFVYHNLSGV